MTIVFTGKLEQTRNEIEKMCENAGIRMEKAVTYNTDVLFVGSRAEHFIKDGYGKKSKKEKDAYSKSVKIEYITSIDEILEYFI